jgi:glycine dehydrogenase subunit 1
MATIYLSCFGKEGLREAAVMNLSKAEYAKKAASRIPGCRPAFSAPNFNEFVLQIEGDPEEVLKKVKERKILGGVNLARFYPELQHHLLVTVTEMNPKEEIDDWAEALEESIGHRA